MHFRNYRWNFFCQGFEYLSSQSEKKLYLSENVPKCPLHTKIGKLRTFSENFANSPKATRWKFSIKNRCFSEKKHVVPFHTYSATLRSVPIFVNSNCEKKVVVGPRELITFEEHKTIKTFFCTSWMHFHEHSLMFFVAPENVARTVLEQNIISGEKKPKCPPRTNNEEEKLKYFCLGET